MENPIFDSFVLTLDMDWAPDCVLDEISGILVRNQVKATWFVTHDSPCVRDILKNKELFDFGLHPNFLPNSTQGRNENEIMRYLRTIVPHSKILRTHALHQSTRLLSFLVKDFSVETDVSLFLPGEPNLRPHTLYFNGCDKALMRIPYFWEDDVEMCSPSKSWDISDRKYHVAGLKIFNFHPMYVYLNCDTIQPYEELKRLGPLPELDRKAIEPFVNKKAKGAQHLFNAFLDFIQREQGSTCTISDIVAAWKRKG